MQKAKLVDNATAGLLFQDSSTSSALDGTILRAIFQNDNFGNLFELVENAGYTLIDDDLSQVVKAVRGAYNSSFTYNTSAIATQTVNDIVLGSDGIFYEVQSDTVNGDNPVGSVTGDWKPYLPYESGIKNLIINPRKTIQQRASAGGKIQVIESDMNVGGNHTLSFTGTATATIYEFPALLADYVTTIADGSTNTLASGIASGEVVTPTAGYHIAIEFISTDFNNVQFEKGSVATNLEIRHNELELCLPFYERINFPTTVEVALVSWFSVASGVANGVAIHKKRKTPISSRSSFAHFEGRDSLSSILTLSSLIVNSVGLNLLSFSLTISGATTAGTVGRLRAINALAWIDSDAEMFNTTATYREDRWFI